MKTKGLIILIYLGMLTGCTNALDNKCDFLPRNQCCPIANYEVKHCGRCCCKGDTCSQCWSCGYYYHFHDQ